VLDEKKKFKIIDKAGSDSTNPDSGVERALGKLSKFCHAISRGNLCMKNAAVELKKPDVLRARSWSECDPESWRSSEYQHAIGLSFPDMILLTRYVN
jgi:hypothetical protein